MKQAPWFIWGTVIGLVACLGILGYCWAFPRVDASFATRAHLRYHLGDHPIDVRLSANELREIKKMATGRGYKDSGIPCCGFSDDFSIRLTDGRRSTILCVAQDECETFRIGNSHVYIDFSERQRRWLDSLFTKY